ncbi:MAG: hypothetical protein K6G55_07285 [Selenomonadaceae bacterium]|nr:hypothetical protein [Selenomonadaceae bacterium]
MGKLSSSMAEKLKNMARGLQDEDNSDGIRGVAKKIKQSQSGRKNVSDRKESGRKD